MLCLPYTENLLLDSNRFNGTINNCLGNLAEMKHMYLYDNELTGTIPDGIGRLEKLGKLKMKRHIEATVILFLNPLTFIKNH